MGSSFGVEGVEGGFEVLGKLFKGLLRVGDGSVHHLVVPSFSVGGSSSVAPLVQSGHGFGSIGGVKG